MNRKELIKKVTYIFLLELVMIILMFSLLFVLKAVGIQGGMITQMIPFLSILLCLCFHYFIIDKGGLNLRMAKLDLMASLLFFIIAIIPAIFDRSFLPNFSLGAINLGKLGYYLLVALAEELFFRAFIRYKLSPYGRRCWIITSAIAFTVIHFISNEQLSIMFFLLIFLFGVIFAVTYEILGSILPLIVFHMAWNFMTDLSDSYSNVLFVLGIWSIMLLVALIIRAVRNRTTKE